MTNNALEAAVQLLGSIHLHAFRWKTDQRNYRRLQLTTTSLEWDLLVVRLVSFAGGARREKKKIVKCSLFSSQCKCQKIDFTVVILMESKNKKLT